MQLLPRRKARIPIFSLDCHLRILTVQLMQRNRPHFLEYVNGLDDSGKAQAYIQMMSIPTEEQLNESVQQSMQGMSRSDMEAAMLQGMTQQMGMSESNVQSYLESMRKIPLHR